MIYDLIILLAVMDLASWLSCLSCPPIGALSDWGNLQLSVLF